MLHIRTQLQVVCKISLQRPRFIHISHTVLSSTHVVPKLRSYQKECIDQCVETLKIRNNKRIAVSLATGGGKTMIFSNLIPLIPKNEVTRGSKVLVLVHRKELADQAINSILKVNPNFNVRLDMGKSKIEEGEMDGIDVIVASVPTLARSKGRIQIYDPNKFKAIIIDECHHAVSNSYLSILKHFEADSSSTRLPVIGFSATLKRHDKIPLKKVFDIVVFEKNMRDLIHEGYLSDFSWLKIQASMKLNEVEVTGKGDYKLDSLAEHVNTEKINELVLKSFKSLQQERSFKSTLFFCVNVQHMEDLSHLFRINGFNAQYVTGSTTKLERERIVNDFLNGKLPILFNCGVFTEGTDFPQVDSIFMVRPTKSQPLLTQMIGRGLRLHDDKEKCVIVDFVDASGVGMTLESTLKGKSERSNELTGVFPEDSGSRRIDSSDTEIEGEIDYIEFDKFEGLDDMIKRTGNKKEVKTYEIKLALRKDKYNWIHFKKHSWALKAFDSFYFKIEFDSKKHKIVLSSVSLVRYHNVIYPKSVMISESTDINEILENLRTHLYNNPESEKGITIEFYKHLKNRKVKITITEKQFNFLNKIFSKVVWKSPRLKPVETSKEIENHLKSLNKQEASDIIFSYTLSKTQAIQTYILNNLLNKKEKRSSLLD